MGFCFVEICARSVVLAEKRSSARCVPWHAVQWTICSALLSHVGVGYAPPGCARPLLAEPCESVSTARTELQPVLLRWVCRQCGFFLTRHTEQSSAHQINDMLQWLLRYSRHAIGSTKDPFSWTTALLLWFYTVGVTHNVSPKNDQYM